MLTVVTVVFQIEGEGHGGLFDARWSPCGLFIAATDSHGHLSHFGVSGNDKFRRVSEAAGRRVSHINRLQSAQCITVGCYRLS